MQIRRRIKLALALMGMLFVMIVAGAAQETKEDDRIPVRKVLILFSEARDLPGNTMLEQAVRTRMLQDSRFRVEFYVESLDAGRFQSPGHYQVFKDYLERKYAGQKLDLIIASMARDFGLTGDLPPNVISNVPAVFLAINEFDVPGSLAGAQFTGIVQRFDVVGTLRFIFELQPEIRRVVVVGGESKADQLTLGRINEAVRAIPDVRFEFWTNQPMIEVCRAVGKLPTDTAVLLSTVQKDVTGGQFYTSKVAQKLAPVASVPVYVLGAGSVGGGALGGKVVDFDNLGSDIAELGLTVLGGTSPQHLSIEVRTNGTPMVDWRAIRRWGISTSRLPQDCVIRFRPPSLWAEHKKFIVISSLILLAQALTIAGLLVQRDYRRKAELEIRQQRNELAHVTRVSTMGQMSSAFAHELNQPLGAILRNTEAAEIFLQQEKPDLEELRAILADIRKDDQRAGRVIDRMRTLLKRHSMESSRLDLRELLAETVALARPDALARQTTITLEVPANLPVVSGDWVHLQQVILNLLLNGVDAMSDCPSGDRTVSVRAAETVSGQVEVAISDRGTGIRPEAVKKIFEPFFTTKQNGMGMGLAISRTIIEAHGGKIRAENNPQQGATFIFSLPTIPAFK